MLSVGNKGNFEKNISAGFQDESRENGILKPHVF